ncbi:MAG: hypothetical protein SGILL_003988 [Bacillariaceae sp.]
MASAIGFEREIKRKDASVRMHMLVAIGAATFSSLSILNWISTGTGDPNRVAAGIVGGVGFLGAAAVVKDGQPGGRINGLNTASGIWVTAAIGTAVGHGYFTVGGMSTLLTIFVQHGVFFILRPKFWIGWYNRLCGDDGAADEEQDDDGAEPMDTVSPDDGGESKDGN